MALASTLAGLCCLPSSSKGLRRLRRTACDRWRAVAAFHLFVTAVGIQRLRLRKRLVRLRCLLRRRVLLLLRIDHVSI